MKSIRNPDPNAPVDTTPNYNTNPTYIGNYSKKRATKEETLKDVAKEEATADRHSRAGYKVGKYLDEKRDYAQKTGKIPKPPESRSIPDYLKSAAKSRLRGMK